VGRYSNVDAANKLAIGATLIPSIVYMESANDTLTIEITPICWPCTIFKDNGTELCGSTRQAILGLGLVQTKHVQAALCNNGLLSLPSHNFTVWFSEVRQFACGDYNSWATK
jgi:hypothetical protein